MRVMRKGRWLVRPAETAEDLRAAQRLRWLCFSGKGHEDDAAGNLDADQMDAVCCHVLIEDARTGQLAGCFRLLDLACGAEIDRSYSAQHYDLGALRQYRGRMVELGRFCVHPAHSDPDILRAAWAALTEHVDAVGAELLFGCSSFLGTDAAQHQEAFAMLHERHIAPRRWLPRVKAPEVFRFARLLGRPDPRRAMSAMPPLLRTYLLMGGWVSDHAVMDRDLGTMHVFTGLEIRAIPHARARALRALAS